MPHHTHGYCVCSWIPFCYLLWFALVVTHFTVCTHLLPFCGYHVHVHTLLWLRSTTFYTFCRFPLRLVYGYVYVGYARAFYRLRCGCYTTFALLFYTFTGWLRLQLRYVYRYTLRTFAFAFCTLPHVCYGSVCRLLPPRLVTVGSHTFVGFGCYVYAFPTFAFAGYVYVRTQLRWITVCSHTPHRTFPFLRDAPTTHCVLYTFGYPLVHRSLRSTHTTHVYIRFVYTAFAVLHWIRTARCYGYALRCSVPGLRYSCYGLHTFVTHTVTLPFTLYGCSCGLPFTHGYGLHARITRFTVHTVRLFVRLRAHLGSLRLRLPRCWLYCVTPHHCLRTRSCRLRRCYHGSGSLPTTHVYGWLRFTLLHVHTRLVRTHTFTRCRYVALRLIYLRLLLRWLRWVYTAFYTFYPVVGLFVAVWLRLPRLRSPHG